MVWQRLLGSLKIQVSFVKEPYKRELYSAKEAYILKEPTNDDVATIISLPKFSGLFGKTALINDQ